MAHPTTPGEIAERWSITDPNDQAFVLPRLSPQPTLTFSQPVRIGNPDAANLRREFILCSESGFEPVAPTRPPLTVGVSTTSTLATIP